MKIAKDSWYKKKMLCSESFGMETWGSQIFLVVLLVLFTSIAIGPRLGLGRRQRRASTPRHVHHDPDVLSAHGESRDAVWLSLAGGDGTLSRARPADNTLCINAFPNNNVRGALYAAVISRPFAPKLGRE